MGKLYLFVEGADDERFYKWYFRDKNIQIVQYAQQKDEKINSFITSITKMPESDYYLMADIDAATIDSKKTYILSRYPTCDIDKIIVTIKEIESWYLAGIDKSNADKFKMKYFSNTDHITKEIFDAFIPNRFDKINFMIEILKIYNIAEALECNTSFKYFINHL